MFDFLNVIITTLLYFINVNIIITQIIYKVKVKFHYRIDKYTFERFRNKNITSSIK